MGWALLALLAAVMLGMDETTKKQQPSERGPMVALVRAEAQRQGLEPALALATVEVESNFNPRAAGDTAWATKRPELYRKIVLDSPAFAKNPARTDARAWHSYGLFQLLAPYHTRPSEHPSVLYDPQVNAQRGIAFIKGLMRKHGDDPVQMRLAYAGALQASDAEKDRVLKRFAQAYQAWHDAEAQGLA